MKPNQPVAERIYPRPLPGLRTAVAPETSSLSWPFLGESTSEVKLRVVQGAELAAYRFPALLSERLVKRTREVLGETGAALISPESLYLEDADHDDLDLIAQSFDELHVDPHDASGRRFRAHGELTLETNDGYPVLTKLKRSMYVQSSNYNPSEEGRERTFDPLPVTVQCRLLWRIVMGLFDCVLEPTRTAPTIRVQLHQISYRATTGPAVSSPIGLHRDGEPFTAVMFVQSDDLQGGDTTITSADGRQLVLAHALARPLEMVLLNDALVLHQVTPVLRGRRDIFLIDFTPKEVPTS